MTRKHFQAFADKIAGETERLKQQGYDPGREPHMFLHVKRMAELVGEVCVETNDRFDYQRFIKACRLPDLDEERAIVELQQRVLQQA